jgi:hypothetical protein
VGDKTQDEGKWKNFGENKNKKWNDWWDSSGVVEWNKKDLITYVVDIDKPTRVQGQGWQLELEYESTSARASTMYNAQWQTKQKTGRG